MDKNIIEIINETVNTTVLKLKMAGLMKSDRKSAYQKTEELLYNYESFKKSDQEFTLKLVARIDSALEDIKDDIYYDIIPLTYFQKETRENIAEIFNTTERTISRNKGRLISELKVKLFSDDVIYELFL